MDAGFLYDKPAVVRDAIKRDMCSDTEINCLGKYNEFCNEINVFLYEIKLPDEIHWLQLACTVE